MRCMSKVYSPVGCNHRGIGNIGVDRRAVGTTSGGTGALAGFCEQINGGGLEDVVFQTNAAD